MEQATLELQEIATEQRLAGKILVPLDGSTLAERVIPYAEEMAHLGGSILLFRVAIPSRAAILAAHQLVEESETAEMGRRREREYLSKLETELREKGIKAGSELVEGTGVSEIVQQARERVLDKIAEEIVRRAEEPDIALIAMTTLGATGADVPFGGVAKRVLARTSKPVFLLRVIPQ